MTHLRRLVVLSVPCLLAAFLSGARCVDLGPAFPALLSTTPAAGSVVPTSTWFVLDFATNMDPATIGHLVAGCNGRAIRLARHSLDADSLVVQPVGDLPAGASCELEVSTVNGLVPVPFQTLAAGTPFTAPYDRRDPEQVLPFPDDFYLVPDASRPTGFRPSLVLPTPAGSFGVILDKVTAVAEAQADGWSPIGNVSIHLSEAPDNSSLPMERAASLDPLSSVALIDLTPGSTTFGERVPFQAVPRSDTFGSEPISHNILFWPGIPLEPEGTYGLVVTDRVLAATGEPLARSAFFDAVASAPQAGEAPEIAATRLLAEDVLGVAENLSPVPIPRQDVVLAVRLSIRSTDHFPDDVLAMRADVLATPPNVQITSVLADPDPNIAAMVEGTFDAPVWLDADNFVNRGLDGLPAATGTAPIRFFLALPTTAESSGFAPVGMYQHGNPGTARDEVPRIAMRVFAPEGFATAGFTDPLNRVIGDTTGQAFNILISLVNHGEPGDFWIRTYAEQMAFLRALQAQGSLDVLPVGAPDGVPDLDPGSIVYQGNSYGGVHGQAFLAYAPDILAGALIAGAFRVVDSFEYQDRTTPDGTIAAFRTALPILVTGTRAPDLWMVLALWALNFDRQDAHNHARFLFREPVTVDGTTRKPSVLIQEGIGDTLVSNNMTRSLAWQLGPIPQLGPALVREPDLPEQFGPIQANVDPQTTAAMAQYAPVGASVPPTPGCLAKNLTEGHFCAQRADESHAQRQRFFQSALVGVPVID